MAVRHDIPALIAHYDRPAPRYTSYPTAPHFTAQLDGGDRARLLSALGRDDAVSLYIHLPFCDTLCHYCGCFTKVVNSYDPVADYLGYLNREIDLAASALSARPRVTMLHFGGGTPNMISPRDLTALLDKLRTVFRFEDTTEIALELDPRILNNDMIAAMADAGVNRVSLGAQDFQPDVQQAVNRIQPFDMVRGHVDALRAHGITRINFDLMYGLPLQTLDGIADNVDKTLQLGPDRVALFGYAHVPWMRPHQKLLEKYDRPDALQRYDMFETAAAGLAGGGYKAIGIDHFARADDDMSRALQSRTLRRNFQGYTVDAADVLIGFGLSSISSFPDTYLQNTTNPADYRKMIAQGDFPVARSCELYAEDKFRRAIIEQLMCYFSVDLDVVAQAHGFGLDSLTDAWGRLPGLINDGLAVLEGDTLRITDRGRPFARIVCACFDQYLDTSQQRHARAV